MTSSKALHPATTDIGLLFLRITIGGLMFFVHGWPKLIRYSELADRFSDPIGLGPATSMAAAIFAEVFCSLLVILGIGTRLAALPLVFNMLVAVLFVHAQDPFQKQEFALMYAIPFLTLFFTGGGRFALGKKFRLLRPWS